MAHRPAPSYAIAPGVQYTVNLTHRGGGFPDKSKWRIDVPEEVDCFAATHQNAWYENPATGWGLYLNGGDRPLILGRSYKGYDLWFAKFVDRSLRGDWHGYPADFAEYTNDRPSVDFLMVWRNLELIDKTQMQRIRQGQKCNP